eukprot:Nk52_evm10s2377 gene=Nk52_evmTU10s2377
MMEIDPPAAPPPPPSAFAGNSSTSFQLPWVEKYRPVHVADIVGNQDTVQRLQIIARDGNLPNIIISGPPGTGKTTSILCLARELLQGGWKDAVLELNASDDRGIEVVRNQIKMFAQKKVRLPAGRHKIVILDEADSMTEGAQQALRRTMEIYSSTTRFALACNASDKIIEALQSRCAILRYVRLSDSEILSRLLHICEKESIPHNESGLEALIFTAQGDMRQAINNLQSTHSGFGFVNGANVFKVCDQPHPVLIGRLVGSCVAGEVNGAVEVMQQLWGDGYSAVDIVTTLFRVVKQAQEVPNNNNTNTKEGEEGLVLPEVVKLAFVKEIGVTHLRVADGLGSLMQLTGLCARLCGIMKPGK